MNKKISALPNTTKAFLVRTVLLFLGSAILILACNILFENGLGGLWENVDKFMDTHDLKEYAKFVGGLLLWVLMLKLATKFTTYFYLFDGKKEDIKLYFHQLITSKNNSDNALLHGLGGIAGTIGAIVYGALCIIGQLLLSLGSCLLYAIEGLIVYGVGVGGMMGALFFLIIIVAIAYPFILGGGFLWLLLPFLIPILLYYVVDSAVNTMALKFYGYKIEEVTYIKKQEKKTTKKLPIRFLCSAFDFLGVLLVPMFIESYILPLFSSLRGILNLPMNDPLMIAFIIGCILLYSGISFLLIYLKNRAMINSKVLTKDEELYTLVKEKLETTETNEELLVEE